METHAKHRRSAEIALLTALVTLPACASFYYELPPEEEISILRDLGPKGEDLPTKVLRYPVKLPSGISVEIAVEEKCGGDGQRLIVLIHGVLSDRRVWRYVVGSLGEYHDLLLVDLPGSGESDKPDPDVVGEEFYAPESLARATLEALRQYLRDQSTEKRITLMAHSLGGRVVLSMLSDPELREEYADVLEQVDSTVLLAGLDVRVERQYEEFRKVVELTDVEAMIGKLLGILSRECANVTYNGSPDPKRTPREVLDRLIEILSDSQTRHAHQAMLRQAVPLNPDGRPDFDKMFDLEEQYRNVDVPCLILWGARDETLPLSMGHKLADDLPQAWLTIFPSCSHALPSERPVLVSEMVRQFLAEGRIGFGEDILRIDDTLSGRRTVEALAQHWKNALPEPATLQVESGTGDVHQQDDGGR